ncbi:uncharacterized protein CC84DRAFT_872183 [Paraphaeosphaeria sporulosa]|uniref:Apple domain-containing protein n=1 Tax=Paraphaeosphaeria sporulosa TaxID=1460663 RepID=A0A177CAU2_9PLEO|nr:uncharacterized protein CC84DRAFT_872183 [Paraphaeosphaeria sporulosa]OAG03887.1 hypothetical protein CC84DRAFT_872183 [Paraphaeosphaeria sporulosa]
MRTFACILAAVSALVSMAFAEIPLCPGVFTAIPDVSAASHAAPVPEGYARSFLALDSAVQNVGAYLGLQQLTTYNVTECAAFCGATNGCRAFNIHAETQTLEEPVSSCNEILFHCALYAAPVFQDMASNYGQLENRLSVFASNGYNADEVVIATELLTTTVTVTSTLHHATTVTRIETSTAVSTVVQTSPSSAAALATSTLTDDTTTATIVSTSLPTVLPTPSTLATQVSPSPSSVDADPPNVRLAAHVAADDKPTVSRTYGFDVAATPLELGPDSTVAIEERGTDKLAPTYIRQGSGPSDAYVVAKRRMGLSARRLRVGGRGVAIGGGG